MFNPVITRPHPIGSGSQRVYRFANNRGASVVIHPFSYGGDEGKFELAVLRFPEDSNEIFELDYTTSITNDVIGHLTQAEVNEVLTKIEALEPLIIA